MLVRESWDDRIPLHRAHKQSDSINTRAPNNNTAGRFVLDQTSKQPEPSVPPVESQPADVISNTIQQSRKTGIARSWVEHD